MFSIGWDMMKIIVQISHRQWTMQAVHLACALARNTGSALVLLQLWQVTNAGLLGTGIGACSPQECSASDLKEYEMIAEDYGVPYILQPMEYESLTEAILQASTAFTAFAVFVEIPQRKPAVWRRLQVWYLRRRLAAHSSSLYLCDQPDQSEIWLPTLNPPTSRHAAHSLAFRHDAARKT